MSAAHTLLLIRHGEIGLKSHAVRNRMERALTDRIEQALLYRDVEAIVRRSPARHYVEAQDLDAAAEAVRHVFGITTFSRAMQTGADLPDILAAAADYAERWWPPGAVRFAIRPRRTGGHGYTSQDIGIQAGSAVYRRMEARGVPVQVDLSEPEFAVHIEVRNQEAFLYHEKLPGPGGLPLGTQGRMVLPLDSGDAAVAAYLMMRRGALVLPYYLPQAVSGDAETEGRLHALHETLRAWNGPAELKPWYVDATEAAAVRGDPLPDDGVPLQRLALTCGAKFAKRAKAQAIVTGESMRSPWARRLPETQGDLGVPVLRPLMGLSRPVIDDFRELLGLARLGGPRATGTERTYTAGGRRDAPRREDDPVGTEEVRGWDPY